MSDAVHQAIVQGGFEGVRPEVRIDLEARNSFSKAVTPEFHDLWIDDYTDITHDQLRVVTPQFLAQSLTDVDRRASNSVHYRGPNKSEDRWVAVSSLEYKQLGGNITTLGNRVVNNVLASRSRRPDFANDRAAAERGGVHAVKNELQKLETYRLKTLPAQSGAVSWLLKSAESPGYAWKNGVDIRMTIETIRGTVFKDMIVAMSEANSWSPEKTAGIEHVLEYRLFFDRSHNRHINNWKHVLGLADEYIGYKKAMYDTKIAKAKTYISEHEV